MSLYPPLLFYFLFVFYFHGLMRYNLVMDDPKSDKRIPIPDSFYQKIQDEKIRTGYSASKLLRGKKDIPKGLNSSIIYGVLRRSLQSAKRSHMKYIEELYAELPDTDQAANKQKFENYNRRTDQENYVALDRVFLKKEMERTGLSVADINAIIREQGAQISFSVINRILQDVQKKIHPSDYELIIECLANAPNYKPPPIKSVKKSTMKLRQGYIALTPARLEQLQLYREKRLLPHGIFKNIPFAPENPKPRNIIAWLRGNTASIHKSDWKFITHHCEKALKAMEQES